MTTFTIPDSELATEVYNLLWCRAQLDGCRTSERRGIAQERRPM